MPASKAIFAVPTWTLLCRQFAGQPEAHHEEPKEDQNRADLAEMKMRPRHECWLRIASSGANVNIARGALSSPPKSPRGHGEYMSSNLFSKQRVWS